MEVSRALLSLQELVRLHRGPARITLKGLMLGVVSQLLLCAFFAVLWFKLQDWQFVFLVFGATNAAMVVFLFAKYAAMADYPINLDHRREP